MQSLVVGGSNLFSFLFCFAFIFFKNNRRKEDPFKAGEISLEYSEEATFPNKNMRTGNSSARPKKNDSAMLPTFGSVKSNLNKHFKLTKAAF